MTRQQQSKKPHRGRVPVAERCDRIGERVVELREAEHGVQLATAALTRAVRFARAGGASWASIASQLGTSRQAAWERFADDSER